MPKKFANPALKYVISAQLNVISLQQNIARNVQELAGNLRNYAEECKFGLIINCGRPPVGGFLLF